MYVAYTIYYIHRIFVKYNIRFVCTLGIMTQTILAIPINDVMSSEITAPTINQQQLQQTLLHHSSNNIRQKNVNRQQLNQTCQPSLPFNRYIQQHQGTDDTTAANIPDNGNN